MARLLGVVVWLTLAAIGLVFALSLAVWLLVMLVFSLVRSVFTGRPAAVTVLWRQYREMTRQRWPAARTASPTPRTDAATAHAPASQTGVQDVAWREVPRSADQATSSEPPERTPR
ncbi:MAG: hypothetical protein Q4G71_15190 [Pseudomonadota bacterium]|nr:hypothetical protein [Pseudomonadota bacterium]